MLSSMRRPVAVALLVSAAAGGAEACPGSSSLVHARAQVTTTFPGTGCDDVRAEMKARIAGQGGWVDPHNGGTYTLLSESANGFSAERVTANKKYTDNMDFTFQASGAGGCELQGCSESQVTSIADFSTNFCNLHDLYCGSSDGCPVASKDFTYTESSTKSLGASTDKTACVVQDAVAISPPALRSLAAVCPPSGFDTQGALEGGFDLQWYVRGKWHIQQQMVLTYLPKEYVYCVTAQYTVLDKPSLLGYDIQVDNYAENAEGKVQGPIRQICSKIGNKAEGKLKVAPCFLPTALSGDYWVVAFDKEEDWALISGGPPKNQAPDGKSCRTGTGVNGSGLWIFTRKQQRDEALIQKIRGIAIAKGFDVSVLNDIDHTKCSSSEEISV
mmetsp:Transcript_92414/g.249301  ORF Transcript_92414/g.249301 Transcript_92414/m.249301 type:complete len:386 (-) Transcript_92414:54-1211(-)